jgi:NAD-dependent dihydropyrimidine dehydrogenase PreA subunit
VIEPLLGADRVINLSVAKHHGLTRSTLGMKNWFGVLGQGRNRLHQDIDRCVGSGICEHRCPVGEEAAIRVSSVGETSDPLNRMLLGS